MSQIFRPASNTLAKASIYGAVFIIAALAWIASAIDRSPYSTDEGIVREQPIPFSHEHHVSGLGIDCRYCHTSVETSAFAGLPPTKTCMTCHSQIWTNAAMLEPVRRSWQTGEPIRWQRVHNLPDFAYFNHSIHIAKGVGCNTCHGPVDQMPLTWQQTSLQMDWCLNCHRHPEQYIRPKSEVFNMGYQYPPDQKAFGAKLVEEYHVQKQQLDDCYICHR
jgi:hypothetical protein